jgi:hypothetical protein
LTSLGCPRSGQGAGLIGPPEQSQYLPLSDPTPTPILQASCAEEHTPYSKHGEEPLFKITSLDSQLKISPLPKGQDSEASYRASVLHQIYQTPVVDPRRGRLLWVRKSFKCGSRLPKNDPRTFKRQDDASFYQNHMQNTQHSF